MEYYKLMIVFGYFVGYAFSVGAFIKLWDSVYEFEMAWTWIACLIWPIIWLFYLPYKLATWIFK